MLRRRAYDETEIIIRAWKTFILITLAAIDGVEIFFKFMQLRDAAIKGERI
jgi:hypothetical protein